MDSWLVMAKELGIVLLNLTHRTPTLAAAHPIPVGAGASEALRTALTAAEVHRLPHQIQRTIRAAQSSGLTEISASGQAALLRLNRLLAPPESKL